MSFAALQLNVSGASSGVSSLASVTVGVGTSNLYVATYAWWGWMSVPLASAFYSPNAAIGSGSPVGATAGGYQVIGVYANDAGTGTGTSYYYYVAVAGTAPDGLCTGLTINGTVLTTHTTTIVTTFQPSYTLYQMFVTGGTTNLFGTSGTKTCIIT